MSEHASGVSKRGSAPAADRTVQRKVDVSRPGDAHEREADTAAEHVLAGTPAPMLSPVAPTAPGGPAAMRASNQPEQKKPDAAPVQRATEQKKPEGAVQRATEQKKPEGAVQRATDPKKPDATAQRQVNDHKQEPPAQRMAASPEQKEPVQRQSSEKKDEPVQRKAEAPAPSTSLGDVAQAAIDSKGPGRPLEPSVRQPIERSLGADLGGTRVHDDSAARSSAAALDARAFTHGSDIWLGPGESSTNLGLMAHEAAHVVQQGSAVQRLVQRNGPAGGGGRGATGGGGRSAAGGGGRGGAPSAAPAGAPPGVIDHGAHTIVLPVLQLPGVADKATGIPANWVLPQPTPRGNQRDTWRNQITGAGVDSMVVTKLPDNRGVPNTAGERIFYLKTKQHDSYIIGTRERVKEQVKLPNWTRTGERARYDVDHIRELQLGGDDLTPNYQLLDASANRSSGAKIRNELQRKILGGIAHDVGPGKHWPTEPDLATVRQTYTITFTTIDPTLPIVGRHEADHLYKYAEVAAQGKQLDGLDVLTPAQANAAGLVGSAARLSIYTTDAASTVKHVPWNAAGTITPQQDWAYIRGFDLTDIDYTPGNSGEIKGRVFDRHRVLEGGELTAELDEIDGLPYTLRVRGSTIRSRMRALLRAKHASPIELDDAELADRGVGAGGVLRPTLPFLKSDLEIDIGISGNDITLSKTFSTSDIALPGPIKVTQASLTISAGTGGLGLEGEATIAVEGVATGTIRGVVSTSGGLGIQGQLDFDSKLFSPARVTVEYRDGEFSGGGELGIPAGKVRGIRSARIAASYARGVFTATGTVSPEIPGVESANLSVRHSEAEGLTIGGDVVLANVPGIQSGSLAVVVAKPPGEEDWKVRASGTAVPAIPGLNTTLSVVYDDGALTITGSASYARGMLSGSVELGVTNRVLDSAGAPTDAISDRLRVYGGGTVTVRIAPWLQGTVGVRFLPNGEIELTGRIGLPDTLEIFPQKSLERNIFSINLDIPIIGFAVLGQRVGIFATIGGGLDLSAGVGPGQLQDLGIDITYNPAHEDQTTIHGGAKLVIPAHAGLRLFIRGALGAGIPIVSASLGLEVGAQLGLEGAAEASVDVNWSPSTGLSLDAEGAIYVQPKFRFDLTGFLTVDADLLLTTINLYEKRWRLAEFELGPDLRFGVRFPIHYQEGQPFDISWDQVEFQVPDVDTDALLGDIIDKII